MSIGGKDMQRKHVKFKQEKNEIKVLNLFNFPVWKNMTKKLQKIELLTLSLYWMYALNYIQWVPPTTFVNYKQWDKSNK